MELTVYQVVSAFSAVQKLQGHIPARTSFLIAKNVDLIEREFKAFEKARNDLFDHYKPVFEGEYAKCETLELTQAMGDELNDLIAREVELPIEVIPLSQVGGMTVDPADMRCLMWMFSNEVPNAAPVPGK